MTDQAVRSFADKGINECPFDFYKWMHENSPVYFDPGINAFIVSDYALIQKVALDTATFSNEKAQLNQWNLRPGGMPQEAMDLLNSGIPQVPLLVTSDPPAHRRYRSLVQMAFSGPRVSRMRPVIERIADDLIDTFIKDGSVELVSQYSVKLPTFFISDQLGVPRGDFLQVKAWADAVVGLRGLMGTDEQIIESSRQLLNFQTYFSDLIERRRAAGPAENDMLDDLLNARIEGERPLNHEELISTVQQLIVAGSESTTSGITSAVWMLLSNPELIEGVTTDENTRRRFVEEVLRLETPVQGNLRRAMADAEIGGVAIPEGSLVQIRGAAGNRDPKVFECPERLRMEDAKLTPHLAFGWGAHVCIGNMLAREEMAVSLCHLLGRLPNLRFSPGKNDFTHIPSAYLRVLKALHLGFDPVPGT